jgi:hypothetical protein
VHKIIREKGRENAVKRRKKRRYHSRNRNSGMKFLGFVGTIISAVICGYLTARFVVAPLLGYETEVLKLDIPSKLMSTAEKVTERKGTEDEGFSQTDVEQKTYVLQFGAFSTKSGAEELVAALKKKDIRTEVKESAGSYKVLSDIFETKEQALKELEALKNKQNIDVFLTVTDKKTD